MANVLVDQKALTTVMTGVNDKFVRKDDLAKINGKPLNNGGANITIDTTLYTVVTKLPLPTAFTMSKIYILLDPDSTDKPVTGESATTGHNQYTEWITVRSTSSVNSYSWNTYFWEKLGQHHTNVVLDGYATEDWVGRNYVPDTILGDERYFNEQPSTGTITGDLSQLNNQVYDLQYSVLSTEAAQALVDATFK